MPEIGGHEAGKIDVLLNGMGASRYLAARNGGKFFG
jgi:hypothetical protein